MHFNPSVFLVYALSGSFLSLLKSAEPLIGTAVSEAVTGKYPFVVSVSRKNYNIPAEVTHICTGSLIANNFVLTAAHCISNLTAEEIRLIVGSVDLRNGIWYNASIMITYDQWVDSKNITKKYSRNDIAVIKLSNKVRNQVAKPVSLTYKKSNDLNDELLVLVGWGRQSENSAIASRYLREAKVGILLKEFCQDYLYDLFKRRILVDERYICTKAESTIAVTEGDSGGPVLRKNYLLGISVSKVFGPVLNGTDGGNSWDRHRLNVHHAVDFYRDFITDVMKHL